MSLKTRDIDSTRLLVCTGGICLDSLGCSFVRNLEPSAVTSVSRIYYSF